jgi:hypothetical protein
MVGDMDTDKAAKLQAEAMCYVGLAVENGRNLKGVMINAAELSEDFRKKSESALVLSEVAMNHDMSKAASFAGKAYSAAEHAYFWSWVCEFASLRLVVNEPPN